MGVHIAALFALFLAVQSATVAVAVSYNESGIMKQPAVQLPGQSEICAAAAESHPSFIQKKSQISRHRGVEQQGLFLSPPWHPKKPGDLHAKYDEVFKVAGNRNAASHLWVSYILDRLSGLSHSTIKMLLGSFCAVSGSPVEPASYSRYKATIPKIGGGNAVGYTYHCCWPCTCDTHDFIKADTKSITDKDGLVKPYQWLVIGNPCNKQPARCTTEGQAGCLPFEAPEVQCVGDTLKGATLSDHGHIIIGALEEENPEFHDKTDYLDYQTATDDEGNLLKEACQSRAQTGYQSGMGEIFRQVAQITPI